MTGVGTASLWPAGLVAPALAALALAASGFPALTGPAAAAGLDVIGGALVYRAADGSLVSGERLVGGMLTVGSGAMAAKVQIVGIAQAVDLHGKPFPVYDLRIVEGSGERDFCLPDADGRKHAVALAGRTDPTGALVVADRAGRGPAQQGQAQSIEFACLSGAQGKCVRFGYAPWRSDLSAGLAVDLFNACVRMVRADYCGRGEAATTAGTPITFSDRFGIAGALSPPPGFAFEASWGPDGALCVAHPRRSDLGDLAAIIARCARLAGRVGARSCKPGTGLIDSLSRP